MIIRDKSKLILTLVTFVLVAAPVALWAVLTTKATAGPGQYDSFAQCLTQSGAKMYGAYWCSHCQNQKKLFGSAWQYINYIECSLPGNAGQTKICEEAKIDGYPTWEMGNGERLFGEVSLKELADKSKCSLQGGE